MRRQLTATSLQSRLRFTLGKSLIKLVAGFEVVSGLAGLFAVVAALVGMAPPEFVSMLWYGIFPLTSVLAGVLLWRGSRFAAGLSILVQLLQVPLVMTETVTLNLAAPMKVSISGIWCFGDECRIRLILGINLLALVVLIILLSVSSDVYTKDVEVTRPPSTQA